MRVVLLDAAVKLAWLQGLGRGGDRGRRRCSFGRRRCSFGRRSSLFRWFLAGLPHGRGRSGRGLPLRPPGDLWRGGRRWGLGDDVVLHVVVEDGDQRVDGAAGAMEVVHVDSPGHGAAVAVADDEVHLDLEALHVLVADPLIAWGGQRRRSGIVINRISRSIWPKKIIDAVTVNEKTSYV